MTTLRRRRSAGSPWFGNFFYSATSAPSTVGGYIVKTKAAILWETGNEPGVSRRSNSTRRRPARCWSRWPPRACATPTSTLSPATCPSPCRSSAATRARGSSWRSAQGVSWLAPGDHVVFGFIPACGRCPSCSTGHQNLCDLGALLGLGAQISDGTSRHHARGQDLDADVPARHVRPPHRGQRGELHQDRQGHPARPGLPARLRHRHRLGLGGVRRRGPPRRHRRVVGVGGIGANAIQGARLAGAKQIIAIDPVEFKREKAMEFGATHTAASMDEAFPLVQDCHLGHDGQQGDHDDGRRLRSS